MRIKLATYNIRRCVGRDGRFDPDRIVAVLHEIGADAVALQEVESSRINDRELLDHIARETGMVAIDGPTIYRQTGRYGNALLTRARVIRTRRVDLSYSRFEKRGAICASLAWPEARMQIVCTHLGLRAHERRWQTKRLLRLLSPGTNGAAALLGDFNEWNPWATVLREIRSRLGRCHAPASFPAVFPILSLDRIWVSPQGSIERLEAHASGLARSASDHLPVKATLVL